MNGAGLEEQQCLVETRTPSSWALQPRGLTRQTLWSSNSRLQVFIAAFQEIVQNAKKKVNYCKVGCDVH